MSALVQIECFRLNLLLDRSKIEQNSVKYINISTKFKEMRD